MAYDFKVPRRLHQSPEARAQWEIDRRRFLGVLATSGVSVYLGGCFEKEGAEDTGGSGGPGGGADTGGGPLEGSDGGSGEPLKVIVIGGGLSGLSAATELVRLGHEVVVLEAQDRVGGRVHSSRHWLNDQVGEYGAVRIPDVHEHTLGYVEELGLELEEFVGGEPLYYIHGDRFMHTEGEAWPLDLTADEQIHGLGMWSDYIAAHFEEFGNPRDGTFPGAANEALWDGYSWTDYLVAQGASDDWLALYGADNGSELSTIGALPWMAQEVADQAWDRTFHVKGGNDLIPTGLAERLGDVVQLNCVVLHIEHSDEGVKVTYVEDDCHIKTVEGDHLICAIPFTILRDIPVSPAFSTEKTRAIDEMFMMGSSRGFFQTRTRFWQAEGIGGLKIAKTDSQAERIWDLSNCQDGATGLITAYLQHENAAAMMAQPEADRRAWITERIEAFFPNLSAQTVLYDQKCWGEDPWVYGAWCDILPGQWWLFKAAGLAEGRVHFCGEHTSIWSGWMQGAIESGKRAAFEAHSAG